MKRLLWVFLALAATVVSVAFAQPRGPQASHRRFLDYLPVGSHLALIWRGENDSYDVRILTAKQVEQRPEELARYEKKRAEIEKELAEIKKRRDSNEVRRANELGLVLNRTQPPSLVYEVMVVGKDFVELRVKWSPAARKAEVESGVVLPAARIREIRLPTETDQQPVRTR